MDETLEPAVLGLTDSTRDFVAGAVSGMAGVAGGQPLDTVRVRQQQGSGRVLQVCRSMLLREGVTSFYRGMTYPVATAALQNAILFQSYGSFLRLVHAEGSPSNPPPLWAVFAGGCWGGLVQTAVVCPIELLKIRLQLQTAVRGQPGYVGAAEMARSIWRREGFRGFYRGAAITTMREVPSYGVYFVAFEECRREMQARFFQPEKAGDSLALAPAAPVTLLTAGAVAGALAWSSVYPLDLVKSRLQATSAADSPYRSWVQCLREIWRREGPQALFGGYGATMGRAMVVNALIFAVYEGCHYRLGLWGQASGAEGEERLVE